MNRFSMKCALSLIHRDHRPTVSESESMFNLALKLNQKNLDDTDVSFPVFLMVSDIYRSYHNVLNMNGGVITENDMRRTLLDNELPNRFTDEGLKTVYLVNNHEPMSFTQFCYGMFYYDNFAR